MHGKRGAMATGALFQRHVIFKVNTRRFFDLRRSPNVSDEALHHYRSIWISDIHLGTAGCQAKYLLDFLRYNESEYLYLVGDIIDGWAMKRSWYWHQDHNDVVQKILRKARKGTKVTYIAGNHDEAIRQFIGMAFGGIDIQDEVIHTTADGRKFLILHGDLFDGVIQCARWLAIAGDHAYTIILKLNRWFNHLRAKFGLEYWSLSQYLKQRVKTAVSFVGQFEQAVAKEAKARGMDGVICGHIHKAEMREIDGILYCNDGDWVESLTALVETMDGELKIIVWKQLGHVVEPKQPALEPAMAIK